MTTVETEGVYFVLLTNLKRECLLFITLQGIKTDGKKITERAVHKNVLRGVFNNILVAKAQRDLMVAVAHLTVSDSVR